MAALEKSTFYNTISQAPVAQGLGSWSRTSSSRRHKILAALGATVLVATAVHCFPSGSLLKNVAGFWTTESSTSTLASDICAPPKPNVFAYHPPRPSDEMIVKASESLSDWLTKRISQADIDSIAVSVVTAAGTLYEAGFGVLRANETCNEETTLVDGESIYRLASISKMFTVLETLILRERGVLNWDDPVVKYLPDFAPPSYGWSNYLKGLTDSNDESEGITLRQLASHLSGLGRDFPPIDVGEWPATGPWELPDQPNRTFKSVFKAVNEYPLTIVPYEYPIYSNTGFDLLGLANVEANKLASSDPDSEPQSHKELLKRDIFEPLGMTSSFFRLPEDALLREHMAVPANTSEWADISLGDVNDAAGGQFSSLRDLGKLMQTLLSATARGGVIPARVVREWLRPLHVWGSTTHQVGVPWEIMDVGPDLRAYTKGGSLPGYYSEFALIPEYSYGIIVLTTGLVSDTRTILLEAAKYFQYAITRLYQADLERKYVGTWVNGEDVVEVSLDKGQNALYLRRMVVGGVDLIKFLQDKSMQLWPWDPAPIPLWSTGRPGEFRLAIGRSRLNKTPGIGCLPYWLSVDPGLFSRGAPIDLLFWDRGILQYPSAGVSFSRKQ